MWIRKGIFFLGLFFLSILFSVHAEGELPLEVLVSSNNGLYLSFIHNLQMTLKRKLRLNYLTSLSEAERDELFKKVNQSRAPFFITLGNSATLLARDRVTDVPILFSMVNAPRAQGLSRDTNTCGVYTDVPISEFFRVLKELKPDLKKVTSFYSSTTGEFILNESDYLSAQYGILLEKVRIKKYDNLEEILQSLEDKKAIYIIPDPFITMEKFQIISDYAKKNKKILMTQIPFLVNVGTTFSITPYYSRAGTVMGEMGNEILSGKFECKDGYAYSIKEFYFNINREYADESEVSISPNLQKRAKNNKLLLEGIRFFEKGSYELSNLVLDKIIKTDSSNYTALYYKSLLNEKLHGEKIKQLFEKAQKMREVRNFRGERDYYDQVLRIEPENEKVQEKIQESFMEESEKERQEGERLQLQGKKFLAIQKYMSSIRISEKNAKARNSLEALRAKESVYIPGYFQKAKELYENRKYDEAIISFKNILLIDPYQKNVLEYLRLSEEKKNAMEKFKECMKSKNKNCYLLWEK